MKQGFIKAAAVTPKIRVADPAYNAEVICAGLEDACAKGAKIIVFPELCITGYTCGDLFLQPLLLKEAARQLVKIMERTQKKDALIMVGLPMERDGRLYNVAAVLCRGRLLGLVPKGNIPSYAEFYEGRHFAEGNEKPVPFLPENRFRLERISSFPVKTCTASSWGVKFARICGWRAHREQIMP